jgi:hypothetical protein
LFAVVPRKIEPTEVRALDGMVLSDDAIDRILATIKVAPIHTDGGRGQLHRCLTFAVDRMRERPAQLRTAKIGRSHVRALRKLKFDGAADAIEATMKRSVVTAAWDAAMLAGNYLPAVYATLTGKRPTRYINGPTVNFTMAALAALGLRRTRDTVIAAMRTYKLTQVWKQRVM